MIRSQRLARLGGCLGVNGLHLPIFWKDFLVSGNSLHHLITARCKRRSRGPTLVGQQQIWGAPGQRSVGTDLAALALEQRFGAGDALQQPDLFASSLAGDR